MVRSFVTNTNSALPDTAVGNGLRVGLVQDVDGALGIQNTPYQLYQFTPFATSGGGNSSLVQVDSVAAPGYLPFFSPFATPGAVIKTYNGETVCQLDFPRCLTVTLGGDTGPNISLTIWSYDVYGVPFVETISTSVGTTTPGLKAHYMIRKVYSNNTAANQIKLDTSGNFGIPYYTSGYGQLASAYWNGSSPITSSAYFPGSTSVATETSGDVRGTILAPVQVLGSQTLFFHIAIPGALGVNGSLVGQQAVQGIPQYNKPFI